MSFKSVAKEVLINMIPVGVGVGAYFIVRNEKKMKSAAKFGVVAGSALGTFLIIRTVKSFGGTNVRKAPVNYGQIPTVFNSAGVAVKWDANPLAKEIYAAYEGYNATYNPIPAAKIMLLDDNQVALLYNYYNAYYAVEYDTLTKLIDAEWQDWGGHLKRAVIRLRSLGLN